MPIEADAGIGVTDGIYYILLRFVIRNSKKYELFCVFNVTFL